MNKSTIIANDMLPVYQTEAGETVVDARELHAVLMIGKDFTTWIKNRIEKYGFVEGEDFSPVLGESVGGRPRTEYILTLDTAKEIAMVQHNEMGRVVRKYFIEVEKRFKQLHVPSYMIDDPIKRAEQWILEQKQKQLVETKNLMLEQQLAETAPKVTYYDQILQSDSVINISQIAKDYGLSGKKLNQILKQEGVQYKLGEQWLLYSKYQDKGYTKSHTTNYRDSSDELKTKLHTKWTQKGRLFIHTVLAKCGIEALMDRDIKKAN
ncbi:phage antirepressor KilAC domain-containing protein [Priestia flexa]|uniref:phage antirepressor KilAC domain-containing protein n=1 Tax=Priestia flexa TaxID=86664 RepID=UPI00248FFEA9|nr:phage antirepressor KilAC domain-containing protein [Priestia flexa]